MNTKKMIALLLAAVMMLAVIGCAAPAATGPTATNPPPAAPPPADIEDYPHEETSNSPGSHGNSEWSDENVRVQIFYDQKYNTHENIVGLTAVVTNIGDQTLLFQKGSGSNRVPDALQIDLGNLTPLFRPIIMTMDMQHAWLEPGESLTFELPFAPYMPAVEQEFPPLVGFDVTLDFFQNEDWVRVPVGEYTGTISFSYTLPGDSEFMIVVEGDEIHSVGGNFQLILLDEAQWPTMPPVYENDDEE